jgi:IgA Peptidase M64
MPIKSIFWSGKTGRDVHVLRGTTSRDLTHKALKFQGADDKFYFADDYLVQFADVTLTFTPLFKGSVQGLDFVGDRNGISVNTSLGSVSVDAAIGINVKNNFIIEVKATNDTGDKETFNETIRVQVHASVTQAWLTPDLLTIRQPLVAWKPRTNYAVGEALIDASGVKQVVDSVTAKASKVDITNNVLTLTVNGRLAADGKATLDNFTAAAFLNGQIIDIQSATGTQITANFTHADFSADDSGDVAADGGFGLSGNGPAPPTFASAVGGTTADNQITWRNRRSQWKLFTDYRFSVRAQFDDNVVGDITENHGVTWNDPHIEADGSVSLTSNDLVGTQFVMGATLPPQLGGATTPVGPKVRVGRAWLNEPSPPKVTLVAGGGLPRAGAVEDAPNILMLSDGFTSNDEDAFDQIVDAFVSNAKTNTLTTPYNLLSSRMNFWKAFVPADEIGISFRSEMYTYTKGGKLVATTIPGVEKAKPGKPWTLANVLYAAGLPVLSDGPPRTPADIKSDWAALLDPDPSPSISDDLVEQWQQVASRTFIEERDRFPGMSYGVPPAAKTDTTYQLDLHADRAGLGGLRPLYRVLANDDLKLADGRNLGVLWAEPIFRFDNTDLVLIISSFPGGRAINGTGYMALSTHNGDADIPVKPVPGKNELALDFTAVPTAVEADRWHTVAHELGHSFGLGDEYADFDRKFPEDHADASFANLQTEKDTEIPNPANSAQRIITGDQIPWVWHRIIAATVVNGDIVAEGIDTFRIPVEPDVSFRFVKDDELLLRPRVRGQPLRKFDPLDISKSLIVLEEPKPDSILVRAVGFISAQKFPAGSLLFKPKPAPASVKSLAYPFAEMIAKNVKDAITANHMPLTVVPCVKDDNNKPQVPILTATNGRSQAVANVAGDAKDRPRIVGLYSGGALSSCGIFHPTGICIMRHHAETQGEFCAVCRYIIVDMIAPEFHPELDALYDDLYPLK